MNYPGSNVVHLLKVLGRNLNNNIKSINSFKKSPV